LLIPIGLYFIYAGGIKLPTGSANGFIAIWLFFFVLELFCALRISRNSEISLFQALCGSRPKKLMDSAGHDFVPESTQILEYRAINEEDVGTMMWDEVEAFPPLPGTL
jgi:hypothetical protein